jgi:hypothetical protein
MSSGGRWRLVYRDYRVERLVGACIRMRFFLIQWEWGFKWVCNASTLRGHEIVKVSDYCSETALGHIRLLIR